jgi:hypothetical protein
MQLPVQLLGPSYFYIILQSFGGTAVLASYSVLICLYQEPVVLSNSWLVSFISLINLTVEPLPLLIISRLQLSHTLQRFGQ